MRRFTLYCTLLAGILLGAFGSLSAQGNYKVRGVHLLMNAGNLDFFLNDRTPPSIGNVPFEFTSANTGNLPIGNGTLNIKAAPAGGGIGAMVAEGSIAEAGNVEFAAIAYGTLAQPKLKILSRARTQVPSTPARTLIRFFDATTVPVSFDIYLDSTTGTAAFTGVSADAVTAFKEIAGEPVTIIVTVTGTRTPVAQLEAPIPTGTYVTFIATGTGPADLKVYMLDEKDPDAQNRKLVPLQTREGLQPTLRIVNAAPQELLRRVDVYLDNNQTARTTGLHYRSASSVYQTATDSITLRFTPYQTPPTQAILTNGFRLNDDSGYVSILTMFRNGSITAYTISRDLTLPVPSGTNARVRLTNASDFFGNAGDPLANLRFELTPNGASMITIPALGFTRTSEWYDIPSGPSTLRAFRPGVTDPIFEGTYTVGANREMTFIALGNTTNLIVDVLEHGIAGEQQPLASFGSQALSVRTGSDRVIARLTGSPNPFSASSRLEFATSRAGRLSIELFDGLGQRIRRIADEWRQEGIHSAQIDAAGLPAGRYHVVVRVDERIEAMGEVVVVR